MLAAFTSVRLKLAASTSVALNAASFRSARLRPAAFIVVALKPASLGSARFRIRPQIGIDSGRGHLICARIRLHARSTSRGQALSVRDFRSVVQQLAAVNSAWGKARSICSVVLKAASSRSVRLQSAALKSVGLKPPRIPDQLGYGLHPANRRAKVRILRLAGLEPVASQLAG